MMVPFLLFISLFIPTAHATEFPCSPDPELQTKIEQGFTHPKRQQQAYFKNLLDQHPDNLFVHRAYQDAVPPSGMKRRILIQSYSQKTTQQPENPLYLYLYARSIAFQNPKLRLEALKKTADLAPDFFHPHLALAQVFSRGPYREPAKAKFHADRALKLCPKEPAAYEYAEYLGDPVEIRQAADRFRQLLEETGNFGDYAALWKLEFQAAPESQHHNIRSRIVADLQKMEGSTELKVLLARKKGYEYLSDEVEVKAMDDAIIQLHPQSTAAFEIVRQRWEQDHPLPKDAREREQYHQKLLRATDEWLKKWPDDVDLWLDRVMVLSNAPAEQFVSAGKKLLQLLESGETGNYAYPLEMVVAEMYVNRAIELEEVPLLVDRARKEFELTGLQDKSLQDEFNWTADRTMARYHIQSDMHQQAGQTLERMNSFLLMKESETSDNRMLLRWKREYLTLKGELAEIEGRMPEAVAFYVNAQLDQPAQPETEMSKPLADFHLKDLSGKEWSLNSLKGKTVFINVWATWCTPCKWELPHIQKLFEQLKNRNDIKVVTFNIDEDPGLVAPYINKEEFSFPVIRAVDYFFTFSDNNGIPTTWFVDRDGVIRKEERGFGPHKAEGWLSKTKDYLIQLAQRPFKEQQ